MIDRAKDGASLSEFVKMAAAICQQAERQHPRTGPGRKPTIPDWVIAVLIMVVVLKQRKSKSSQYRFLVANRCQLLTWMKTEHFPSRSTYFHRYRRAHRLLERAIELEGDLVIGLGLVNPRCVAVDQSIVKSRGRRWNKRQRARGRVPQGADLESSWTYSSYHGWILGYSYEVVVSAEKTGPVWPLLASADPASWQAGKTFPDKIDRLPATTRYVLADAGYDSNQHGEMIEYNSDDRRSGCRLLCPQIYRRGEERRPDQPCVAKGSRRVRRERRDQRRQFFERPWAQKLYRRRGQSVEPFNDWLKTRFDLHDRAWHRGLDNNRTQMLASIFCYQLMLRYNHNHGRANGQIQWIIDTL